MEKALRNVPIPIFAEKQFPLYVRKPEKRYTASQRKYKKAEKASPRVTIEKL